MTGSTLKQMSRVNTYRKENICYSARDISDGQEINMFLTNNRERNNKQDILAYSWIPTQDSEVLLARHLK